VGSSVGFMWESLRRPVSIIKHFLAVGLLKMRGIGGHAGWRWLFLIEGLLTREYSRRIVFIAKLTASQSP
jgi:hypothetical protein